MKTKLFKPLPIFLSLMAATLAIEPFRECDKNSEGKIIWDYMGNFDSVYFCRPGQVLYNKTVTYQNSDKVKTKYCCETIDLPAIQTASEPCLAFRCHLSSDGIPWRGDLLVHAPDLYCESGYELKTFDTTLYGNPVKGSCCDLMTTTTQSTTPLTSKSIIGWILKFFNAGWNFPLIHFANLPPLVRVRRQTSDIPKTPAECVFVDGGKTNPVPDYMSYDEKGLSCRTGQILLNSTRNGNEVFCCRYSSTSVLDVPKVIASRCVFENGEPLMWSMHSPGGDLLCKDPDIYELVLLKTTHLISGKAMTMTCCKKIESTTTTTTTVATTTTKGTTPYKPPLPYLEDGEICLKAGNDCVFQGDGSIKISYMDFEARGAYCRPGQATRMELDSKNRRRVCCEPMSGGKTIDLPPLCPSNCVFDDDGMPLRWSLLAYTPDLICKPKFELKIVDFPEGQKCCCMNLITTTTSTTSTTTTSPTTTSSATTISPTSTSSSLTTTQPNITTTSSLTTTPDKSTSLSTTDKTTKDPRTDTTSKTTEPPTDTSPAALSACYYDVNRKVKTDLMELCKPTKKCRVNEIMLDETVGGKRLCCCDFRKELPPPTDLDPKLIAPKCYYDEAGNVNQFSTLISGQDLICPNSSNMMNYTDEKDPSSCCILKTMTTIPPKNVPPGTPPGPDAKVTYPDCTFKTDGKLDYKNMVYCSDSDKICRPQFKRRPLNFTNSKNENVEKCCCEPDLSLPLNPNPQAVYAPICVISPYSKTVKKYSMIKSGPDLICKAGYKMHTIIIPELSHNGLNVTYSCCMLDNQIIPPTDPSDKVKYAGPRCVYTEKKELQIFDMEKCSIDMVCRDQEKMFNKTFKDPVTKLDALRCCCEFDPKLPHKESKTPVRAHDCYFDYFNYIVMHSLLLFGKDLECQKNFTLVNYTIEIEAKPTIFSCCFPIGVATLPTTPYLGKTLPMTTSTTMTPGGKRTAAPQKLPSREVKQGECPDCIMPPSAQAADIKWVIAHLERPGPPAGKCPQGYTMRRVYPVVERRDLTATKCCCESNAFPLPVKIGG